MSKTSIVKEEGRSNDTNGIDSSKNIDKQTVEIQVKKIGKSKSRLERENELQSL
jgi:hypothetical protein